MKAAADAKATVTNLEAQLNALKAAEASALPQAKGAFQNAISGVQGALDAAKKNAADKEAAAKSTTTTPATTTTGGGAEDKVKAAADAKATVTNLEAQLNALKAAEASALPQAKGAFQNAILGVQGALDAAKKNAADKEAAAKSTDNNNASNNNNRWWSRR